MKAMILIGMLVASAVQGSTPWRPDDHLLDAVRHIESTGGKFVYGDDGKSLGEFQIRLSAWTDVNRWRAAQGQKTYEYRKFVLNPAVNRAYAADYLAIIHRNLSKRLRRDPSVGELYAAYNMGLTNFGKQCGYNMARINKVTAGKCREITQRIKGAGEARTMASAR